MSVLLPGPHLFLNEFLDHLDHIFRTALEHIGFSSLPVMARAFWKHGLTWGPFFVTCYLYVRCNKSSMYCHCSEEFHGLGRRPVVPKQLCSPQKLLYIIKEMLPILRYELLKICVTALHVCSSESIVATLTLPVPRTSYRRSWRSFLSED